MIDQRLEHLICRSSSRVIDTSAEIKDPIPTRFVLSELIYGNPAHLQSRGRDTFLTALGALVYKPHQHLGRALSTDPSDLYVDEIVDPAGTITPRVTNSRLSAVNYHLSLDDEIKRAPVIVLTSRNGISRPTWGLLVEYGHGRLLSAYAVIGRLASRWMAQTSTEKPTVRCCVSTLPGLSLIESPALPVIRLGRHGRFPRRPRPWPPQSAERRWGH